MSHWNLGEARQRTFLLWIEGSCCFDAIWRALDNSLSWRARAFSLRCPHLLSGLFPVVPGRFSPPGLLLACFQHLRRTSDHSLSHWVRNPNPPVVLQPCQPVFVLPPPPPPPLCILTLWALVCQWQPLAQLHDSLTPVLSLPDCPHSWLEPEESFSPLLWESGIFHPFLGVLLRKMHLWNTKLFMPDVFLPQKHCYKWWSGSS